MIDLPKCRIESIPEVRAMSEGRLLVEKRGATGWLVFDNPAKRNALNAAMWRGIPEALAQFESDPRVRCVVLRGSGTQAFTAGADISDFDNIRAQRPTGKYESFMDQVLDAIQGSSKPSIAMIHGFCFGGGLELALACDLRYCGTSAQFAIPAAKLGVGYNVEGHKRLLETVGHAQAREIMFLGRRYDADEAVRMGLVNRAMPDAELESFVEEALRTLSENAPLSIANSKTIIEEFVKASGEPDHARMKASIERARNSSDLQEGRRAFAEKRKPNFRGS
jgi:enoyl-CoA hydratase/carnithine racemase